MSIYINQLIQQLNLPNIFVSTVHPNNNYLLTAKLEPLFLLNRTLLSQCFLRQTGLRLPSTPPLEKQKLLSQSYLNRVRPRDTNCSTKRSVSTSVYRIIIMSRSTPAWGAMYFSLLVCPLLYFSFSQI